MFDLDAEIAAWRRPLEAIRSLLDDDMKLAGGRGFSDELDDSSGGTKTGGVIVNETLARTFGIDDPIGADLPFTPNGNTYRIVGVVSDFHFRSLNEHIEPAIIAPIADYWNSYIIAKLNSADYDAAIDAMSASWSATVPDAPFDYFFLDEAFDAFYRGPHRLAQVFGAFSTIAIVIACLGLFGLATYTAHQRVREIGIRKVLGASVSGVVTLLTSDFLKLIAVSFVVAAPLAWIAMNSWLTTSRIASQSVP